MKKTADKSEIHAFFDADDDGTFINFRDQRPVLSPSPSPSPPSSTSKSMNELLISQPIVSA